MLMYSAALPCLLTALVQAGPAEPPVRLALPQSLRADLSAIHWTPELTQRLIAQMPKVETHLHLDGALSARTILDLAVQQNYAPLADKSLEEIQKIAVVQKPKDSLAEVLQVFHAIYPLLHTAQALERVAYDLTADAARQNIRHFEARFAPALQAAPGFTAQQALEAALKGLERGRKDFGVTSGVVICLIRPFSLVSREANEEMLELAIAYKDKGVVGIDLAGNEAALPLSEFRDFYERAKAAGLKTTAHAGEVPGSRDLETAMDIGVDRLGHATLLRVKPRLLKKVRRLKIPIEVNLTSNLRTAAVQEYEEHPVRDWYRLGVLVTISSDDPGVFGIDLNHEYLILANRLKFAPVDIVNVVFQGLDALFLPEDQKQVLRRSFEAELSGILNQLKTP